MSKQRKTKSDVIEDLKRIYRDIKDPKLMSVRDKNVSIFILYVATICCRNETGKRKVRNEGPGSNGYKQLRGYTDFPNNVSGPCYVLFFKLMNEKKVDRSKVKPKDFDRLSDAVFYKYVVKIDGKETEDNNLWINDLLNDNYVELLNNDSLIEEMKEDIDIIGLDSCIDLYADEVVSFNRRKQFFEILFEIIKGLRHVKPSASVRWLFEDIKKTIERYGLRTIEKYLLESGYDEASTADIESLLNDESLFDYYDYILRKSKSFMMEDIFNEFLDDARKDCDKSQLFPKIKDINEKLAIDPWDRSKKYVEGIVTRYEFHILEEHVDELEDYDDWFDAYKDLCLPKRLLDDLVKTAKGESVYMPMTIYEVLSESLKQNLSAENDSRQKYAPLEYIRDLEEKMQYRFDGISPTLIDDCYKDLMKRLDNSRNYCDCRKKKQRESKGSHV